MPIMLRFVVHTIGVSPLATFDNKADAIEFARWKREIGGYPMDLTVSDQQSKIDEQEKFLKTANALKFTLNDFLSAKEIAHSDL